VLADPGEPPRHRLRRPRASDPPGCAKPRLGKARFEPRCGTLFRVDRELESYRVTLPFTSRKNHKLNVPVELPGAAIAASGSEYVATLLVTGTRAEDALAVARSVLGDVLGAFAVRGVGFVEVHDARRQVGLVDPKPVLHGPIPPFDSVGGGITAAGAELFDPTGEQRRARRIANFNAEVTITKSNFDKERQWLKMRQIWPNEVRRAVALTYAGELSGDLGVAFVLAYSALEVLAPPSAVLLSDRIPDDLERRALVDSIRATLRKHSLLDNNDVDRLINSLSATNVVGPIPRFTAALDAAGIAFAPAELEWVRAQRGNFVHPGRFDESPPASSRRDVFRRSVGILIEHRLDGLHQTVRGE